MIIFLTFDTAKSFNGISLWAQWIFEQLLPDPEKTYLSLTISWCVDGSEEVSVWHSFPEMNCLLPPAPAEVSADRRSGTRQLRSCFSHSWFSSSSAVINNVTEGTLHYAHIIATERRKLIFILHFLHVSGDKCLITSKVFFNTNCLSLLHCRSSVCTTQQQSPKQRDYQCQTSNWYSLINSQLVNVAAKEPGLNLSLIKEGW